MDVRNEYTFFIVVFLEKPSGDRMVWFVLVWS